MEISAIIMIITEIVLTLVLVYEIIRKNRFATLDSSICSGRILISSGHRHVSVQTAGRRYIRTAVSVFTAAKNFN